MKIGAYEVVSEIGRGGMGVVYRARAEDGREVAVKVLKSFHRDLVERFAREQRLLAELGEEQGFVSLLEHGVSPTEGPYLVMPFHPGGTLRTRLARGPLAVDEALRIGLALARALGAAHALGVVHRDVKPENVLFDARGEPLLADFGLAKHFSDEAPGARESVQLSRTGSLRGTLGYMPPEQMNDAKSVGPAADVFAVGAIIYECLAGVAPFAGATPLEIARRALDAAVTPISASRLDAPRWLEQVVARALALDPERRFPDGAALAAALETRSAGRPRALGPALVVLLLAGAAVALVAALARGPGPGTLAATTTAGARALVTAAEALVLSPVGGPTVEAAERGLVGLGEGDRAALEPRVAAARLLRDLAQGTSASVVLQRARALPSSPPEVQRRIDLVRAVAARECTREAIREIVAGRIGEERARLQVGPDLALDFASGLALARLAQKIATWRPPAYDELLSRFEKLRSLLEPSPDPLVTAEELSRAIGLALEHVDDATILPLRDGRNDSPLDAREKIADRASSLAQLLGPGAEETRVLARCLRVRWFDKDPRDLVETADALRAIERERLSPDASLHLHALLIDAMILHGRGGPKGREALLRYLLDLHRGATRARPLRTFRARVMQLDILAAHAALAADLSEVAPAERTTLVAEAKALLARHEADDLARQDEGSLRAITGIQHKCATYLIARVTGDQEALALAGGDLVRGLAAFRTGPMLVELVIAADFERSKGRLVAAASFLEVAPNDGFKLGRDHRPDHELLTALLRAEQGAPGALEALAALVERMKKDSVPVLSWLLREAEATLAR